MARNRKAKGIRLYGIPGYLSIIAVVILISGGLVLGFSINPSVSPATPNPTDISAPTNIPTATQRPQTLSEKDLAYQILLQHSSFQCPNITDMRNWIRSVLGDSAPSNSSMLLRNKDELLWACFVYYAQEYQSASNVVNARPVPQPIQTQAYHYTCNNFMCERVKGEGSDTCTPTYLSTMRSGSTSSTDFISYDTACAHTECQNYACVLVPEPLPPNSALGCSDAYGCFNQ